MNEPTLLRVARAYEAATDWHEHVPRVHAGASRVLKDESGAGS
jgi:hypothetical protein